MIQINNSVNNNSDSMDFYYKNKNVYIIRSKNNTTYLEAKNWFLTKNFKFYKKGFNDIKIENRSNGEISLLENGSFNFTKNYILYSSNIVYTFYYKNDQSNSPEKKNNKIELRIDEIKEFHGNLFSEKKFIFYKKEDLIKNNQKFTQYHKIIYQESLNPNHILVFKENTKIGKILNEKLDTIKYVEINNWNDILFFFNYKDDFYFIKRIGYGPCQIYDEDDKKLEVKISLVNPKHHKLYILNKFLLLPRVFINLNNLKSNYSYFPSYHEYSSLETKITDLVFKLSSGKLIKYTNNYVRYYNNDYKIFSFNYYDKNLNINDTKKIIIAHIKNKNILECDSFLGKIKINLKNNFSNFEIKDNYLIINYNDEKKFEIYDIFNNFSKIKIENYNQIPNKQNNIFFYNNLLMKYDGIFEMKTNNYISLPIEGFKNEGNGVYDLKIFYNNTSNYIKNNKKDIKIKNLINENWNKTSEIESLKTDLSKIKIENWNKAATIDRLITEKKEIKEEITQKIREEYQLKDKKLNLVNKFLNDFKNLKEESKNSLERNLSEIKNIKEQKIKNLLNKFLIEIKELKKDKETTKYNEIELLKKKLSKLKIKTDKQIAFLKKELSNKKINDLVFISLSICLFIISFIFVGIYIIKFKKKRNNELIKEEKI